MTMSRIIFCKHFNLWKNSTNSSSLFFPPETQRWMGQDCLWVPHTITFTVAHCGLGSSGCRWERSAVWHWYRRCVLLMKPRIKASSFGLEHSANTVFIVNTVCKGLEEFLTFISWLFMMVSTNLWCMSAWETMDPLIYVLYTKCVKTFI